MAENMHTTRRALLKAAPAFAMVPAAAVANEPESELRALYRKWQAIKEAYNTNSFPDDAPESLSLIDRMIDCEERAAAYQPRSVEDYAFKIIFADEDGYLAGMSPPAKALAEMAHQITGIEREA